MRVLGINAVFHDPAAALVVDGEILAAAEEERFSRRKSRKRPVPFSNWEIPELSAAWCLAHAGLEPADLDAVAYSYDPDLVPVQDPDVSANYWEGLRTIYVRKAPLFLSRALPGLAPEKVHFVPHHVAHAASAHLAAPHDSSAVLTVDGRGEMTTHLSGHAVRGELEVLRTTSMPHSLGLLYEDVTEHLGFRRSADEYKVMALAAYGTPRFLDEFRRSVVATGDGSFTVEPLDLGELAPRRAGDCRLEDTHADLAASVQRRLEEVLVELAEWLWERTREPVLTMAGGTALNCVANSVVAARSPFETVWVQPAAGDAGTALGAALHVARSHGETTTPMTTASLGRGWEDVEIKRWLSQARVPHQEPADVAAVAADALARNQIVALFHGRSEFGPRALGHRSLLANPASPNTVRRLNEVKGREQFRPVAPMVPSHRAAEIFDAGPLPSPYMLFTHQVRPHWRKMIPSAVHVDGSARIQTVDEDSEPLVSRILDLFDQRTGIPVVINTSFNTAERPMVDHPRDAVECFATTPIDLLVLGPYVLRRADIGLS